MQCKLFPLHNSLSNNGYCFVVYIWLRTFQACASLENFTFVFCAKFNANFYLCARVFSKQIEFRTLASQMIIFVHRRPLHLRLPSTPPTLIWKIHKGILASAAASTTCTANKITNNVSHNIYIQGVEIFFKQKLNFRSLSRMCAVETYKFL